MPSPLRSPSRGRDRSATRSPPPRSAYSRSPSPRPRRRRYDSRSISRSPTPPARRNGRYAARSRSRSVSWGRGRGRSDSRDLDDEPNASCTKIVVERLTKTVNEDHLYEIFGQYGHIKDLDLPISRQYGTNRGIAFMLYDNLADAEDAIAHLHEAQIDGATISVSIVLPRRKMSPPPPTAKRGANIDPRVPFNSGRGGAPPGPFGGGGGARRRPSPPGRYGPRSDVYRPSSRSVTRSRSPAGVPSRSGGSRYRSISKGSVSSRSRSISPRRRGGGGRYHDRRRSRSPSRASYDDRSRSHSRSRSRGYR